MHKIINQFVWNAIRMNVRDYVWKHTYDFSSTSVENTVNESIEDVVWNSVDRTGNIVHDSIYKIINEMNTRI